METRNDLRHLILHFTSGRKWTDGEIPVIERGEACHVFDDTGVRHLDGMSGLFVVQIGHGRQDIVDAVSRQLAKLAYMPSWSTTHPSAIEAAGLVAELAPGDLDAVFFVNSGSEAVDSAIKFARQYHRSRGNDGKTKVISRHLAYHGTTFGALSATGLEKIRAPFEPLLPGFRHVPNTLGAVDGEAAAQVVEQAILEEGPESVGLVIAEPVQNGGGAIVPPDGYWPQLRRICDTYDVLLAADEVINGFGRVGRWFGSELVGADPDLVTFAKGATSGYAPVGGLLVQRELADELLGAPGGTFLHGATWGAHPAATAATIANLTAMRDEKVVDNVVEHAGHLERGLRDLMDAHDVVADVRGTGYLYALDLCASRSQRIALETEQVNELLQDVLPRLAMEARVLVRGDDRGEPKVIVAPPLIAGTEEIDELVTGLDRILDGVHGSLA